jgi:hypothetical protein
MTTTKRYPLDPYCLTEDDFLDSDGEQIFIARVEEHCLNCDMELGHTDDGFVRFWRDADLNQLCQDDAWCDLCVDDPSDS